MKRNLIALMIVLIAGLASATAQAQIPVTDGANLTQQMRQFLQMMKEYEMLKQQYDQLKRQYEAITGRYGFGNQFNNAVSRRWVPGSWQEVVAMQKSGKFGSKQDFYEKLLKTIDPLIYKALGKDTDSRMYQTYKLSTDATRGAFAAVEALYDSIGERLKSIEGLQGQIESTDNVKAAQDLGNRLLAENAYLNVEMARLNTIQTNLSANAQNMGNQSMAARTEFFNFGKE
jgi:type IV secretion system protein VirB5